MSLEELVARYISSAAQVFQKIDITGDTLHVDVDTVNKVVDWAKAYLKDAEFYREKKRFEVSLTSVAYCEGLLDALRLLGAVSFEWTPKTRRAGKAK